MEVLEFLFGWLLFLCRPWRLMFVFFLQQQKREAMKNIDKEEKSTLRDQDEGVLNPNLNYNCTVLFHCV
jgi:hypothetical protein